jgi:SAM-dependent methyltransferase
MSYSQGVAPYYDLFKTADSPPNPAAVFLSDAVPVDAKVLDIGAGTASTAFALAEQGMRVTALEPDPEMYAVMLARLAGRPAVAALVTPVLGSAGFNFDENFDVCYCFQVLHLIDEAMQANLIRYAAAQLQKSAKTGKFIVQFAVDSTSRANFPWEIIASRNLGELRLEHHRAHTWITKQQAVTNWKFVTRLGDRVVHEVTRDFHWKSMPYDRSEQLLVNAGFKVLEEYAGFDRTQFVRDQSDKRIVVAALA